MDESLLRRFQVYETVDVDESREKTGQQFRSHRLSPLDRRATGFRARHHVAPVGRTSLHYVTYGECDTLVHPGPLQTFYVALIPRHGSCTVTASGQAVTADPSTAAVVSPEDDLSMLWSAGTGQLLVKFPQEALIARLELALQDTLDEEFRFQLGMNIERGPGREWYDTVVRTVADLDARSSLLERDAMLAAIEQVLMTGLLFAQPHNYSHALVREGRSAGARLVRSVVTYVEDCSRVPAAVADLVAYAGVSERALQRAFREQLNTSPKQYLIRARLRRVHQALLRTDPDSPVTATDIAISAGVTHLSWFWKSYREHFGEHPSDTKRRRPAAQ